MDPNWSTRRTFELFIYGYLIKRNMHQTAEVFRYESNLQLGPCASSSDDAMNALEGFLQEWWSLYGFDFLRAWLQHDTHGLEAAQECNASQEAGCSMNVEAMTQLPNNFTPVETVSIGRNSIPSHVTGELPLFSLLSSQRELSGQLSQFFSPFSHQEINAELSQLLLPFTQGELLTSTMEADNVASACIEVEQSIQNTSKPQYTGFSEETDPVLENLINSFWLCEQDQPSLFNDSTAGESNKNMENLFAHGEGNNARNELVGSPPTLRDGDNTSEAIK